MIAALAKENGSEGCVRNLFSMTEPAITPELVAKHNLTPEE